MVNNLSNKICQLSGWQIFLIWLYSSCSYLVIPPTKAEVFSIFPQEYFLLDIWGVPLVGMQSIRRA